MRAEKLELASPTSSSKNEPTTVEYLELERHRLYSAAMTVKQMSFACLKVELCAFEKFLRYVRTDSSTYTLKIPPMNVTAVTDHCNNTKCEMLQTMGSKIVKDFQRPQFVSTLSL